MPHSVFGLFSGKEAENENSDNLLTGLTGRQNQTLPPAFRLQEF
jgi:hypothetical protein